MEDMVLDTALILRDMVMAILAILLLATAMDMDLAMALTDMESAMLMLSQRLMPMLSTVLMEDMVLDTALILWDMVMAILAILLLATAVDMLWAMDMDMDMVMDMAMVMDMDIMVELSDTTNQ